MNRNKLEVNNNNEIQLIAIVKDSKGYINYYLLKDNVFNNIIAVKPKDMYHFIIDANHIRWNDKPTYNHTAQITSDLMASINLGKCYLKSNNGGIKEIGLGLYKRLFKYYGKNAIITKSGYLPHEYGSFVAFDKDSIDNIILEINNNIPKSQGINKKSIGIKRQSAEKIIEETIETAKQINSDPNSLYKVTLLGLFGSYINSNKEKLGDIDMFFTIKPKDNITKEMIEEANEKLLTETEKNSFFEKTMGIVYKSYNLTIRRLRQNHTSISLQDYDELKEFLKTEQYQVIFTE